MQNKNHEQLILKKLNFLIKKGLRHSFYKDLYKHHLHLFPLKTLKDFSKLPTIKREDFFTRLKTTSAYVMKSRKDAHGNEPIVPITKKEYKTMVTNEWERFVEAGIKKNDRVAVVDFTLNHAIPIVQSIIEHNHTYVVIEGTDEEIFHDIIEKKVTVIFTHIRIVYKLLEYAKTYTLQTSPLRLIITGGETIADFKKTHKEVEQFLKAELIDTIGTRQLCTYAIQNPKNSHYHFMLRGIHPEILQTHTGEKDGEVVITPFWKNEFPLIRFKTGDVVKQIDKTSFEKIGYRVGNEYKIGSNMLDLKKIYDEIPQALCYQYFFDKILWKIIKQPHYNLILTTHNQQDTLLLFVEKNIFLSTFRRKKPIIDTCVRLGSIGCIVIPVSKKKLQDLSIPHGYIDIRYITKHLLKKNFYSILKKKTIFIDAN